MPLPFVDHARNCMDLADKTPVGSPEFNRLGSCAANALLYGEMLKAWQRMINAIDRGFGEASFTPHRVLQLMRNCTPPDVRQLFTHLPD